MSMSLMLIFLNLGVFLSEWVSGKSNDIIGYRLTSDLMSMLSLAGILMIFIYNGIHPPPVRHNDQNGYGTNS